MPTLSLSHRAWGNGGANNWVPLDNLESGDPLWMVVTDSTLTHSYPFVSVEHTLHLSLAHSLSHMSTSTVPHRSQKFPSLPKRPTQILHTEKAQLLRIRVSAPTNLSSQHLFCFLTQKFAIVWWLIVLGQKPTFTTSKSEKQRQERWRWKRTKWNCH